MRKSKLLTTVKCAVLALAMMATSYSVGGRTAKAASQTEIEQPQNMVTVNQPVVDKLTDCKDENWYYFDITQPGYFNVSLAPTADAKQEDIDYGWTLVIYDKANWGDGEIRSYNRWTGTGTTATFPFHAGRYYIKVDATFDHAGDSQAPTNVPYSLTVNFTPSSVWEVEGNDSDNTANFIAPDVTYYGTTYHSKDQDWFKLTATKKGYYELVFVSDENNDLAEIGDGWTVSILNAEKNEIKSYSYIKSSLTSLKLPFNPGDYYIHIFPTYSYRGDSSAPTNCIYRFTWKQTSNASWEKEGNDSQPTATPIKMNKSYIGNTYWCKDADWYKFKITKKGPALFTLTSDAGNDMEDVDDGWTLSIYKKGATNPALETRNIKSSGTLNLMLPKGEYYLRVYPSNTYNGDNYAPTNCQYTLKTQYVQIPDACAIKSVKSGKKSATITWKKNSAAQGYYIYRSTKPKSGFKKIATIKKGSTTKYVDKKGLKSKKKYYYRVAAYNKLGKFNTKGNQGAAKGVVVK